jgi:phosphoribosylaminoimidazole carboxylase PurE protein
MSAQVGIIMGSQSDWATMKHAADVLGELGVAHETRIISAHRTPDLLFEYASTAIARGLHVIIAGAGGAAHLPGMTAAKTRLPVLGVPVSSKALSGLDSLLSIAQMPRGVPGKKGVTAVWHHLLIAQDTGGGIVGAVRGDIYWGDDAEAAELGGRMGGPGKYWLLLPRGVSK